MVPVVMAVPMALGRLLSPMVLGSVALVLVALVLAVVAEPQSLPSNSIPLPHRCATQQSG
jgi:hypothetical protein